MANINDTLNERGERYGSFEMQAEVTQQLKNLIFSYKKRFDFNYDQVEALEMICNKLGRIINGDHNYADSWVDIAGYSKLVADRLEKENDR